MTGVSLIKHNDILEKVLCIHDVYCDGPATVGGGGTAAAEESEYVSVCGVYTHVETAGHGVILDGVDTAVLLGEGVACRTKTVTYGADILTDHSNLYGILILAGDAKESVVTCEAPGDKSLVTLVIKVTIGYLSGVVGA